MRRATTQIHVILGVFTNLPLFNCVAKWLPTAMKSSAATADIDDNRNDRRFLNMLVGSTAFKWVLGVSGAGVVAIFIIGWNTYAASAASNNPDVVGAKADIDVLKTSVRLLAATANEHTIKLTQAADAWAQSAEAQKRSADMQGRIFDAIKGVGTDVHALDVKIATVNQKVDDLKEQVQRK